MRKRIVTQPRPNAEGHVPAVPETQCNRMRWDAILDRLPEDRQIKAAEIGVLYGATSARLLRKRPLLTLYMIDAWAAPAVDSDYYQSGDTNAIKTQGEHDKAYGIAKAAVGFAENRAHIIRQDSLSAADKIPDHSLDLVFIDGDHSAKGVSQDVTVWIHKIKPGGWICGHDYDHPLLPGVKEAVDQLFRRDEIILDANRTWFVKVK